MHLVHDNLHLLLTFDALLEEGSVGGAAARLHLSQPAMSRALGRLRRATGDEILVRSGRRMLPTAYALSVRQEVRDLVDRSRAVLTPPSALEPETLQRQFSLRANDAIAIVTLPLLMSTLRREAPGVVLRLIGEEPFSSTDTEIDVSLGSELPSAVGFHHEILGTDRLVVVASSLPAGGLDADGFASRDHIIVSRRGRTRDRIDDALETLGLIRQVVLTTPTLAAALEIVCRTDLVTVAPSAAVRASSSTHIVTAPLPLENDPISSVLVWHARYDRDPAQKWFRDTVAATVRSVLR